ncbi:nucleoside-diphosphate kinase [bacterium]|nr:nucleoside-diphosphate kinase [bacterium]
MERTLTIIKPDAVARNLIGTILAQLEQNGLRIIALKRVRLTKKDAEAFYAVHRERPFYKSLTDYMTTGPVVVAVLEGEQAISTLRSVMGATNPAQAEAGTIRARFAENVERNSIHGSDAPETAAREISFFFNELELHI